MKSTAQKAIPATRKAMQKATGNSSYDMIVQSLQVNGENWSFTPRAIGVTASARGEGVTSVAANLAITAANASSHRVLLVDTNFSRPNVTRMFRLRGNTPGLLELLAGEAEFGDCIQDSPIDQLSVLAPGKRRGRNGLSGFTTESLEALIDQIKFDFQLVVFDLPPASDTANCLRLAGLLDGILLVVTAGGVAREQAKRASKRLDRCGGKVLGVVLNKAEG